MTPLAVMSAVTEMPPAVILIRSVNARVGTTGSNGEGQVAGRVVSAVGQQGLDRGEELCVAVAAEENAAAAGAAQRSGVPSFPLVTSPIKGTAMKSRPLEIDGESFNRPGTIIGKALEPLSKGTEEILVLLSLQ